MIDDYSISWSQKCHRFHSEQSRFLIINTGACGLSKFVPSLYDKRNMIFIRFYLLPMVIILDCKYEKGALVLRKISNLIYLRHLFKWNAVTDMKINLRKGLMTFTHAECFLSYHLIKVSCFTYMFLKLSLVQGRVCIS